MAPTQPRSLGPICSVLVANSPQTRRTSVVTWPEKVRPHIGKMHFPDLIPFLTHAVSAVSIYRLFLSRRVFQIFSLPGPQDSGSYEKKIICFSWIFLLAVSQNKRVISFILIAIMFPPRWVSAISIYRFPLSRIVSKNFSPPDPPINYRYSSWSSLISWGVWGGAICRGFWEDHFLIG